MQTKEQAYDALVHPLMAQIIAICKEHRIPMLASFTLDCESGLHCTTHLLDESWEPSEELLDAADQIVSSRRPAPVTLTTRNGKGEITSIETII